jgi:hypothetical protein
MQPLVSILAQPRSAFRLHIVVRPLLQSLPYPSACSRARISKPLACLLRFITAASPPVRIQSAIHAPTKRRMRPIRRVLHETVFHRVEMRVVHVSRKVPIVAYRVLPIRRCQMPRLPRLVITGDRDSPVGKHFTNAVLIAHHRPGSRRRLVARSTGNAYDRGRQVDAEGAYGRAPGEPRRAICRFASSTDPNGVPQVHCKEEGSARNPIAAIIRPTASIPALSERRKALRFSALRLLTEILCPLAP